MKIEPEVQVTGLLVLAFVMCCAFVAQCVARQSEAELKAPIVETCVKHPATVSPFKQNY